MPPPPTPRPGSAARTWLPAVALAAAAAALYAPAVGYGFVTYDDPGYVYSNPFVVGGLTPEAAFWAFATTAEANWHPLTWLSLQLDVTLFGPGPAGFHATNAALHSANTALVFVALRRLTGAAGRSAAVALVWAAHPLHVESVAWVAERKDVLSGFFGLLAVWAYARHATAHRGGMRLVAALLAVGLLAKPMLVTLPCAFLLLDWWPLGRLRTGRDVWPLVREKLPLFVIVALSCGMTFYAQNAGGAVRSLERLPAADRAANAAVAYAVYLGLTAWPADLAVFYPLPAARPAWQPAAAVALLAAVTAGAWAVRRSAPYLLVGWLWFVGTLVPVVGLVQVGAQAYADRYTYLPHVGLFVAAVWGAADGLARLRAPRWAGPLLLGVIAAGLSVQTRHQIAHWRDPGTLWLRAAVVTPHSPTAWHQLGAAHLKRGEWGDAVRCLRVARRLDPDALDTRMLLDNTLYRAALKGVPIPPESPPPGPIP